MNNSKLIRVAFFSCMVVSTVSFSASLKAELVGAGALLDQLDARTERRSAGEKSEVDVLQQALADYQHNMPSQTAEQNAKDWMALLLDSMRMKPLSVSDQIRTYDPTSGQPLSTVTILTKLPPPDSWPDIIRELESAAKRSEFKNQSRMGLDLLAAALQSDYGKTQEVVAEVIEHFSGSDFASMHLISSLKKVESAIMLRDGSSEHLISSLAAELNSQSRWSPELELPDLVALIGPEEARKFINSAVQLPNVMLSVPGGGETLELARQIALDRASTLKTAQWKLAQYIGSIELYEAMERRFGTSVDDETNQLVSQAELNMLQLQDSYTNNSEREKARLYYLFSLIAAGRESDALDVANSLGMADSPYFPKQALYDLHRAGYSKQVLKFLQDSLESQPEITLWGVYINIANFQGIGDKAAEKIKAALADTDLSDKNRIVLRLHYADALLASNNVSDAIVEFQQLVPELDNRAAIDVGLKLANVGLLLDESSIFNIGTEIALQRINQGEDNSNWNFFEQVTSLSGIFLESNQAVRAEALLFKIIADTVDNSGSSVEALTMKHGQVHPLFAELMRVYHESQRQTDILMLLDDFSMWGAMDLQDIALVEDSRKYPLGYYAANAFAVAGQSHQATEVAKNIIRRKPGFDLAYELLVELEGEQAIPFLEEIYLTDQFEERPLIWMAIALSLAGNNDLARETIQKAIAIDPTDGEQGRNHRLRAYATLANILDAQGDKEGAQTYRDIVRAVRISELADRYNDSGLQTMALKSYNEANELFTDAYCIQARLAIRLTEQGRHSEAAEHYRKAYELMPDQFGRVESHCLGCENIFAYPEAASIAEGVFLEMLESRPDDPQVNYLLGYLYTEQNRYPEALEQFRAAVALDPEYLNAWKKLNDLGRKTLVAGWERELAILKLMQLDPLQRHVSPDIQNFLDLKSLYTTIVQNEALKASLRTPGPLYPLQASEEKIQSQLSALPDEQKSLFELQQRMAHENEYRGYSNMGLLSTNILASVALLLATQ